MTTCHTCGNDYDAAFTVIHNGTAWQFDSFECAITALAPTCASCGCRVLGHGVQVDADVFCCAHCARRDGHGALNDRTSRTRESV
ncbi:hypothetical protein P0W64_18720 [Tsukamurella sp. 8F]|uniref:hypothetical protein n=1 Tax=unclassified Tsukamurella TaxID=2633480 RepID=UPI0023B970FF|nr:MULTISPECIES: hypothetical protein [unclassified Tsukamurella]MDF0532349.1 hypothetical protein [Tsukamurella sp. 8J]MDF0588817.1 hypothetical protein [Tsukamurella sp. 8F]